MENLTRRISRRYNRVAGIYDALEFSMERMFEPWRQNLMTELSGKVLEVGVGTGKNIPHYPNDVDFTCIDFSRGMVRNARRRLARTGRRNIEIRLMDVQALDFPDNSFDAALTTCVFCSVPDPVRGLREILRVVRPGGKLVMLEHVRSEHPILGPFMDLLNPLPLMIYGANINRRTVQNLASAGFKQLHVTDVWRDVVKKIVAVVP